jgi:hypothetical protein
LYIASPQQICAADYDGSGTPNLGDVEPFVAKLLGIGK